MALERRDPLPAGRYWQFLLEDEGPAWAKWTHDHSSTVRVIATERKMKLSPYRPAIMVTRPDLSIIMEEGGAWVLFDVLAPTPWVGLGYPTIVTDPTITRSEQVEQAPAPQPDDQLAREVWGRVSELLFWTGVVYLGGQFIARKR